MEEQIQHLDGVESATITFATKQLRLNAADPDALLPQIRKICTSIESEVKVVPRNPKPAASADVITKIYLLENLAAPTVLPKWKNRLQTSTVFPKLPSLLQQNNFALLQKPGPLP